jgi:hypothetical protein
MESRVAANASSGMMPSRPWPPVADGSAPNPSHAHGLFMRSPQFIFRAGIGLGLFIGMVATIIKAWTIPESATGYRYALIGLALVLMLGVRLLLPESPGEASWVPSPGGSAPLSVPVPVHPWPKFSR